MLSSGGGPLCDAESIGPTRVRLPVQVLPFDRLRVVSDAAGFGCVEFVPGGAGVTRRRSRGVCGRLVGCAIRRGRSGGRALRRCLHDLDDVRGALGTPCRTPHAGGEVGSRIVRQRDVPDGQSGQQPRHVLAALASLVVKGQQHFPVGGQLISLLADNLSPCPGPADLLLI
ncbi:MAG: hypothetical protein ACT4RN_23400 [Pseudonocardia sp.]